MGVREIGLWLLGQFQGLGGIGLLAVGPVWGLGGIVLLFFEAFPKTNYLFCC